MTLQEVSPLKGNGIQAFWMTVVEVSNNRVHKFEKSGWSGVYLFTRRSINRPKKDGLEDVFKDSGQL